MTVLGRISVEQLKKWLFYALASEAFFVALSPALATVSLYCGIALLFLRGYRDDDFRFRRTSFDWPIIVFVLFSLASVGVSPKPFFSLYNFACTGGCYVLSYILAVQTIETEEQVKILAKVLAISALLVVLYGYYQYCFGINISDVKWVDAEAFPELKKRVFSTWENPNILAGYLDEAICMLLAFFAGAEGKKQKTYLLAGLLLLAICLAMTYARGACLAVAVVIAGYGAVRDRRILLGCIFIGAVILMVNPTLSERLMSVFTKMDTSSEMRLALWESSVAMIEEHPIFGIGWGAYWMVYPEYDFYINDPTVLIVHAHNLYLNYAAEIGLIGAAAYFAFFFGSMFKALKHSESASSDFLRSMNLGTGLALISVALGGMTDNVLFNIPTSMLLWLVLGISEQMNEL